MMQQSTLSDNDKNISFFPMITHLSQVMDAIKDVSNLFTVQTERGFVFIKYKNVYSQAFPDYSSARTAEELEMFKLRRECRGLVFRSHDGQLLIRRFHKFFNFNERPDCDVEKIDFHRPFICLEKMDGSLVSPIEYRGKIQFCTMLGFTKQSEMADQLVKYLSGTTKYQYEAFSKFCIDNHMTPCFELISSHNRIVIKYDRNELILLGVRHNESGEYCSYEQVCNWGKQYGIPVVKKWNHEKATNELSSSQGVNGEKLIQDIRRLSGVEGYVFVFTDNYEMFKCKTISYSVAHQLHPERIKERQMWKATLENVIDDLVSLVDFDHRVRDALQRFRDEFEAKLIVKVSDIISMVINGAKKITNHERQEYLNSLPSKHDKIMVETVLNGYNDAIHEGVTVGERSNEGRSWLTSDKNALYDITLDKLHHYLISTYIEGPLRFFTEDRQSLYDWLNFSMQAIHPFDFEQGTGVLRIRKSTLKALNSEAYKQYVDLHYSMMNPKKGNLKNEIKKMDRMKTNHKENMFVGGDNTIIQNEKNSPAESDMIRIVGRGKTKSFTKAKSKKGGKKKKGK